MRLFVDLLSTLINFLSKALNESTNQRINKSTNQQINKSTNQQINNIFAGKSKSFEQDKSGGSELSEYQAFAVWH
jgi:hypothetical protein